MAEILTFPSLSSASDKEDKVSPELVDPTTPQDAAARKLALDPQRSFLVEAPAGSGKTGLLMQRFLTLLGDAATAAPEEILAITFTRKATAELRERIVQQLEAADADAPLASLASSFETETHALARAALARDRQLGWNLLTSPRRLRIQTIDSLCMEIAGTLPLLSGAAARSPVDDASELYREAARSTLRQLGGSDRRLHAALETVLLHRDGNLADVERLLAQMLGTREQWAELVPLDRATLTDDFLDQEVRLRLERTLERIVCSGLTRVLHLIPAPALSELATLAHNYAGEPGYNGRESPVLFCSDHPGPPAAEAAHLDHWRALLCLLLTKEHGWRKSFAISTIGFKFSKQDETRLKQIIAEIQSEPLRQALESVRCLPPARYPDDQWMQAKSLFRLLLHALAELQLLFARTGESDFTEFSLSARLALSHHAENTTGTPLHHLLVDEMQDTSSAQYDLLTALTRSWDGGSQTLFLVGDPKQSIYLFRQARVERFLRTGRDGRLGDVPLTPLQLTANFRSRPALVAGVNEDAASLFTPPGQPLAPDTVDVPFVAATATRSPALASGIHWHTRILSGAPATVTQTASPGAPLVTTAISSARLGSADANAATNPLLALAASADPNPSSPAQQDAATIRSIVERWRGTPLPPSRQATPDRPAQPWRIAVLANARRHLAPIVAEFSRTDAGLTPIPYRAINVEPLETRPEVLDTFALTRALHHPADRAAWFAVLRAPWCGLDAADLLTLAAEADPAQTKCTVPQLVSSRATLLSTQGRPYLNRAWPTLEAALQLAGRTSQAELIERTWISLGADAFLNPSARTNAGRYFALLREAETGSTFDLPWLRRRLKELYAESDEVQGAVELMTIHSAKGLEWDVVLVPELGRQGQRETSRLLNWLELESGAEPAVLLAPIQGKGDRPSALYQWLSQVHSRRLQAERRRVFYVACTRAREELHLFATARQGTTALQAAPGSILHACWPAAEVHFARNEVTAPNSVSNSHVTTPDRFPLPFPLAQPSQPSDEEAVFALAAAADPSSAGPAALPTNRFLPQLTRLPLRFDPLARFREAAVRRLPYTPAADLLHQAPLTRPEGSAAVRALGNVVHRFLEVLATQLAARPAENPSAATLQNELPLWLDRLTASFRGEGLAPAEASREAGRALTLLANTLADPVGLWLLAPHPAAASERALATASGLLRVDRTFLAGSTPLAPQDGTLWIVDFKTTSHGGRNPEAFAAQQRQTYGPQLSRYAEALRTAAAPAKTQLGLYFPAIPRLIHWPADED